MESRVVLKFGGSSLESTVQIRAAARRIAGFVENGSGVAAVVSAMGDRTDRLLDLANEAAPGGPCPKELDRLLATGEMVSAALLTMALKDMGIESRSFDGCQAGFRASGRHGEGRITAVDPARVAECIDGGSVAVVAGFQAVDEHGDVITLGRGGSDLSAIALASALKARCCYILTDVDGIYTADPKIVEGAKKLDEICWDECLEMTVAGARVLQARSVEMAMKCGVDVCVASSFCEDKKGTRIVPDGTREKTSVRAVSRDDDAAKVAFSGGPQPCHVARALSDRGIVAQVVAREAGAVFLVRRSRLEETVSLCRELGASDLRWEEGLSRISVVGSGLADHPGIWAGILSALGEIDVEAEMLVTSAHSITCVVGASRGAEVLRALHEKLIEGGLVRCA